MLKLLKQGRFTPSTAGLSGFQGNMAQILSAADTLAKEKEKQVKEIRNAYFTTPDVRQMTDEQIAALAEITVTELAYLQRLGEVGCFIASSYSDDQNQQNATEASGDDTCSESEEEDDGGFLKRTASRSVPMRQATPPPIGNLAANMLIASGKIRQQIGVVCQKLSIMTPVLAATLSEEKSPEQREQSHQSLVSTLFTRFGGGKASIEVQIPIDGIFEQMCQISESIWNLMSLCAMTSTFHFIEEHQHFKTIDINPDDSIFGNDGWRIVTRASLSQTPMATPY
jgi:hypothetical protein